jgi:hypothetical protein
LASTWQFFTVYLADVFQEGFLSSPDYHHHCYVMSSPPPSTISSLHFVNVVQQNQAFTVAFTRPKGGEQWTPGTKGARNVRPGVAGALGVPQSNLPGDPEALGSILRMYVEEDKRTGLPLEALDDEGTLKRLKMADGTATVSQSHF